MLTHKYLLNWTDWPCVWKPSATLASLSHSPWLSSCLPGVLLFNLLFSCQYLTWKWSSLFYARPSSLLPGPIFFGALSCSNYCLHADVSQIHICSLILLLRFRLTCSTLWNWMSHMHSESICPKFISSSCLLPFQSYFFCLFSQIMMHWSKNLPKRENWKLFWLLSLPNFLPSAIYQACRAHTWNLSTSLLSHSLHAIVQATLHLPWGQSIC